VLYKEINLNTRNRMQKRFDLYYLYENTKCSLVDFQKHKINSKREGDGERIAVFIEFTF